MTLIADLPPEIENVVDRVCDAFEQAWRDGRRPKIEAYLAEVAEAHRETLFTELLLSECECRRRARRNAALAKTT